MSRAHRKNNKRSSASSGQTPMNGPVTSANEVLTLAETATYLRVREAEVIRLVQQQDLPARLLGNEWRFLKSAVQNWLQAPARRGSKEAILSVAGAWKD